MGIYENVKKILSSLPANVTLEAAAKTRSSDEIVQAVKAGVTTIGENYLQEGIAVIDELGDIATWHYIGKLQSSKVRKIVSYFDMIETVDSLKIAEKINDVALDNEKIMPILLEVNSAREDQKSGFMPDDVLNAAKYIDSLDNISVRGLMTMGMWDPDPEHLRPYFSDTHLLFESLKSMEGICPEIDTLSMGMSASYPVAIEEGATLVRIGEGIFGSRK